MVLNLRDLEYEKVNGISYSEVIGNDKPAEPLFRFETGGFAVELPDALAYECHEYGYLDAMIDNPPCLQNVHYRQGYLSRLIDASL